MKLEGIITPLITPFSEKGEVFEEGLRDLINFQMKNGVGGLFICGTYGCGPLMTTEQRKKAAEITVDQVNGKISVIVHVGASSVNHSLELAKHAEDVGADAVASVPPFYYAYDDESVLSFYKQLLSTVNIPVFIYNNPARTGIAIGSELLKKLADEGVTGIKDSSFNMVKFYEDLVTVDKKDFIFIIGTEALMLPAIMAGAKGCVSGLANIFPEKNVECYKLIKEKKYEEASIKQMEIIKARNALHTAPTIPACYEALRIRGINVGYPKTPFRRLKAEQVELIKYKLAQLGWIF
jgi:N-acetylneuraminate lyase/4-hydroxy-tetrahydrodipicolinate synthase